MPVIKAAYNSVAPRGIFIFVGASVEPGYELSIDIQMHMGRGIRLYGCVEGDSVPHEVVFQGHILAT